MLSERDMYRKLCREIRRFRGTSGSRGDISDAAINAAATAWHLTDWVWKFHQSKIVERLEVDCLAAFQDWCRINSPALAACDIIANAFKHGGTAHRRDTRPDIETILIAQPLPFDPGEDTVAIVLANMQRRYVLKVEINGERRPVIAVLESVSSFWHGFLLQYCRNEP
jgi:hypothetical protein